MYVSQALNERDRIEAERQGKVMGCDDNKVRH